MKNTFWKNRSVWLKWVFDLSVKLLYHCHCKWISFKVIWRLDFRGLSQIITAPFATKIRAKLVCILIWLVAEGKCDISIIYTDLVHRHLPPRFRTFNKPNQKNSFSQNCCSKFENLVFSPKPFESTQQRGHFAVPFVIIGSRSSENDKDEVWKFAMWQILMFRISSANPTIIRGYGLYRQCTRYFAPILLRIGRNQL